MNEQIAENAARRVLEDNGIQQEFAGERALEQLAWELGNRIDFTAGMRAFAAEVAVAIRDIVIHQACGEAVTFDPEKMSAGNSDVGEYYAACETCDEDVYEFETSIKGRSEHE